MRVGAHAAAVERRQDSGLAAALRVGQGRIGLMAVEVQRAAAVEIEDRKRRQVVIVAAAHDGALAVVRHDEGERGLLDGAGMQIDVVFLRHVEEHVAQPVVGQGGDQVGLDAEFRAAERRRDGIAAERNRIFGGDGFLVALRHVIGKERHVDIGLADE